MGMGSRRLLRGCLRSPPLSPTPAGPGGQQLRPPPDPTAAGEGAAHTRAHTQMAREEGKVSSRFNQITNICKLQTGTVAGTPMHALAPKATGQRARRARGGGPGHRERGARAKKPSRVFSMEVSPVPGTAECRAGNKGTTPPPRRLSRADPCRWAKSPGLQIKTGGAGLGCTAEPGSARPPAGPAPPPAPRAALPSYCIWSSSFSSPSPLLLSLSCPLGLYQPVPHLTAFLPAPSCKLVTLGAAHP